MAVTAQGGAAAPGSDQPANTLFAGPVSGAVAPPAFRVQVIADLPLNIPNNNFFNSGDNGLLGLQELGAPFKGYTIGNVIPTNGNFLTLATQRVQYWAVYVPKPALLSTVAFLIATSGVYTSTGYNGFALNTINTTTGLLTQVAATTSSTTIWAGAGGYNTINFATPYAAVEGVYFLSLLYQSSAQVTAPQLLDSALNSNAISFLGAFPASIKLNGILNAQTSIPTTQLMSGLTQTATLTYSWFL